MTPEEIIPSVSPIFARTGSAWYFVPETVAAGRAVGLDGYRFYFLGRGGTLGDVDWRIVSSAFGYFNPSVVKRMWTTGRERCPVSTAVAAHLAACATFARRHLNGLEELEAFCVAAEAVVAAAGADVGGLPLFAGYTGQPLPDDPAARALQLIATLRELRGSTHLAAVAACGLPTPVAHALRRPDDVELFGWKPGEVPTPSDEHRKRLADADQLTDRALVRAYATLDAACAVALVAGAQAVDAAIPATA